MSVYLSEIEEEAGVLASLWEVGEEHGDADEQYCGVLAHLTQRLMAKQTQNRLHSYTFKSITWGRNPVLDDMG